MKKIFTQKCIALILCALCATSAFAFKKLDKAISEAKSISSGSFFRELVGTVATALPGRKQLENGVVASWRNQTEEVRYNSYRVEVTLSDTYPQNVIGDVTLEYLGTIYRADKPLFIPAGEKKGYVDFSDLPNGRKYKINVNIRN